MDQSQPDVAEESGGGASPTPIVSFEGVEKRFGDTTVLQGLDFEVQPREHVTLIGPSGSGKTTILRLLMTLESVDGGVIRIDGEPLSHMERKGRLVVADEKHLRRVRSNVGMVFQHFNLFPHMRVLRNVTEGPIHGLGVEKDEAETRARELLDLVGVKDQDIADR